MSIVTAAKNAMLDALLFERLSLHTGFPGATGANEVAGGGYARVVVTFGAAASGARSLTASANVTVPACTVAWAGVWTAAGVFRAYSPNGGNPLEFQVQTAADTITAPAHGYSDGQTIVFYGDTCPSPLVEGTVYYVRDSTADTFKVAASAGGAVIDLTTTGGSACVVSRITLEVYGGAGTHTISAWSIGLPN
jgi:hypothetical protein